ncbi:hypothetical protein ACFQ49_15095 [Kroppenstedtia eburnea]
MDFLSLLWAAFLAFGPVVLAHWLKEKKKSGTRGTGNRTSKK